MSDIVPILIQMIKSESSLEHLGKIKEIVDNLNFSDQISEPENDMLVDLIFQRGDYLELMKS
jgi:hypothetical protein